MHIALPTRPTVTLQRSTIPTDTAPTGILRVATPPVAANQSTLSEGSGCLRATVDQSVLLVASDTPVATRGTIATGLGETGQAHALGLTDTNLHLVIFASNGGECLLVD